MKNNKVNNKLSEFLDEENLECKDGKCVIKGDKSIVEVISKKMIVEDGRQLLFN